jgi:hypothetical protein
MKRYSFLLIALICFYSLSLKAQIKLTTDNKIGIGTSTPSTFVEVYSSETKFNRSINGGYTVVPVTLNWYYSEPQFCPTTNHKGYIGQTTLFWKEAYIDKHWYLYQSAQYSDNKFKKNIVPLNGSLDRILKLMPVKYDLDFTSIGSLKEDDEKYGKNQLGLIAQDVLKIVPEVVVKDSIGYAIDYNKLVPLLIEAVKEQQIQIVTLQKIVAQHEEEILALEKNSNNTTTKEKSTSSSSSEIITEGIDNNYNTALYQNTPNPFNTDTKIDYSLNDSINKAYIIINDLNGNEIKQIELSMKGHGSVIIHGSELKAGMYLYTLIANNIIIDTKRMVLTEL